MIKRHGVSLAQFVLTGEYQLCIRYMNACSSKNRLDFKQQFKIIESVLSKEDLSVPNYEVCIKWGISPKDITKMERIYIKGVTTSWQPTLSKEDFLEFYAEFNKVSLVLPNGFDIKGLSPEQLMVASSIYRNFKKFYVAFNFEGLQNFQGSSPVNLLFGSPIIQISRVLDNYKKLQSFSLLRESHPVVSSVLMKMRSSNSSANDPHTLQRDLAYMVEKLNQVGKLLSIQDLPELSLPNMWEVWLRLNEAGLIGLDPIIGEIVVIPSTEEALSQMANNPRSFLYELLERDISSQLQMEGRIK